MNPGYAIKLPLKYDSTDGPYVTLKTLVSTINQNLKTLFLTNPGERIMDINFGIGIKRYLFENFTPLLIDRLEENIKTQIAKYIKGIVVNNILVKEKNQNINGYILSLNYSIPGISSNNIFEIGV